MPDAGGQSKQHELFADTTWRQTFRIIPKLPCKFEDAAGKESRMRVLDWEADALYWNCLRSVDDDEPRALEKVR